MIRLKLISAAAVSMGLLSTQTIAQTSATTSSSAGATLQLQWNAIEVDAAHFKAARDWAVNGLRMHPLLDQANFAVLAAANGSLLEIYGPGSKDYPWRHGQGGTATGFLTDDIALAISNIRKAGGVLVGDREIFPKAGADGGDYAFQLFKAPDGRIYAIAQNKGYKAK